MKVAEKDIVVHGMLEDEYGRCREGHQRPFSPRRKNYPRGALNVRRKQNKGKEYAYHYLVRRDGKKVINRHISDKELPELQKLIEEREKCRKENTGVQETHGLSGKAVEQTESGRWPSRICPIISFRPQYPQAPSHDKPCRIFDRSVMIGSWVMLIYQKL